MPTLRPRITKQKAAPSPPQGPLRKRKRNSALKLTEKNFEKWIGSTIRTLLKKQLHVKRLTKHQQNLRVKAMVAYFLGLFDSWVPPLWESQIKALGMIKKEYLKLWNQDFPKLEEVDAEDDEGENSGERGDEMNGVEDEGEGENDSEDEREDEKEI